MSKDFFNSTLYPLILNNSVQVPGQSNVYRYTFPVGSIFFSKAKIAVAEISMYYSWFNITAAYNNKTFQFIMPTLAGSSTYTVTLPDGYYDVPGINAYLQQFCITNGLYLVNSTGAYVYFLEFKTNANYYAVQFNAYPVPTSLPAGWTNPGGLTFPIASNTPQLIVNNNNFSLLVGISSGTYPSVVQTTNYSKLSSFTPQISPVQSVIVACSLLNNKYSNPSTILYSFTSAGVAYGALIDAKPNEFAFIEIQEGSYSYFDISFLDQNYNPLKLNDNNLVIQLLLANEDDNF